MRSKFLKRKAAVVLFVILMLTGTSAAEPLIFASEVRGGVSLPYVDVRAGDWFYDAVSALYDSSVMTGLDQTHFGPGQNLARAQFAVILWRIDDQPLVKYPLEFPDVKEGKFYSEAVRWAASERIITGYTDSGLFGAGDTITREQMAAMLYRYVKKLKGYPLPEERDSLKSGLSSFPDAQEVSAFAQEGMEWCVQEGIITGDRGRLKPQDSTNRAETAAIIWRFSKIIEKELKQQPL